MGVFRMKKRQDSADGPPTRSAEREALAVLQNELTGAARAMAATHNTVVRVTDLRDQLADVHALAAEAASTARAGHAETLLYSARTGEAVGAASNYRELRHAAADAADDLEAANAALETAEQEFAEASQTALAVKKQVLAAADAVLLVELPAQIARVRAAIEGLITVCEPLDFLRRLGTAPADLRGNAQAMIENIRVLVQNTTGRDAAYPAKHEWEAARVALTKNPDAPLPTDVEA